MDSRLDLNKGIRPELARMEDSLILDLFERAKYKVNEIIYIPGGVKINDSQLLNMDLNVSFLDFLLRNTEETHALAGRFLHPEEHSFSDNLPAPVVNRRYDSSPIKSVIININTIIKEEVLTTTAMCINEAKP